MKRVGTAVLLALFALYSIFCAPVWLFFGIVGLMGSLCYFEFTGIAKSSGVQGPLWLGYILGIAAIALPQVTLVLGVILLVASLTVQDLKDSLVFAGTTLLGIVYIYVGWRWAADLRQISSWWLFYALSINWIGDAAAFYVGRSLGRHKLAPRISPGKSWEGAAGSMVATVAYGVWLDYQVGLPISTVSMVILSLIANAAGQAGDLAESALKRGAGLKDSGTLLPGHGGFLDRLDSSLFTLPVVYYFLLWGSNLISR